MTFNLSNGLIACIFVDEHLESLLFYLDDIVIFSSSFAEHLQGQKVLGNIISAQGASTDPEKIQVVEIKEIFPGVC